MRTSFYFHLNVGLSGWRQFRFLSIFMLLISVAVCLMLFASCQKEKESALVELKLVNKLSHVQTISTDVFSTEMMVVPLETRDDVLIKYISKVILADDLLVIVSNNRCMLFQPDGTYIRTVGTAGQGPEEYLYIGNVYLSGDELTVFDADANRVVVYKTTGEFVRTFRLPNDVADILPGDNCVIGHVPNRSGQEVNRLKRMDLTGAVLDSLPTGRQYESAGVTMVFYPEASLYAFEGEGVLTEICHDTIYTITPDFKLQPRYRIDLGDYAATAEARYALTNPRESPFAGKRTITNLYESQRYLFFYGWGDGDQVYIYDKKEEALTCNAIRYSVEMKKRFDKEFFVPRHISEDHSTLITSEQSADIEDDSNPVLVLLKLKR